MVKTGVIDKLFRPLRKISMPAHFNEYEVKSGLKNKRALSTYLDSVIRKHLPDTGKISLNYIFCTDAYLLNINQQYLDHDTYTDIITFDLSEEGKLVGEIYISTERVTENAETFGNTYIGELHRVIFHGALHLCGFLDKTPEDEQLMREKENECLSAYKLQ
jgi:rRNA maturation RNase YbeY